MKIFVGAIALVLLASCAPKEEATPQAPAATETTTTETATTTEATATTATQPAADVCTAAPNRLCPSDDASLDPSLVTFRNTMLDAVKEKDETKLKALLDPKIRTSFGEGGGSASFKMSDHIWHELDTVLNLGGGFQGDGAGRPFWAPYVYAKWPEAVDAFSNVAAIRKGVVIRSKPESSGSEVATIDWEILELIPGKETAGWRHVRTTDKKEGWVSDADVRSPIGYRAGFTKASGDWKMNAFVAGD